MSVEWFQISIFFFWFKTQIWNKVFTFHHIPLKPSASNFFSVIIIGWSIPCKDMYYSTSFTFENHSLSYISFDEIIVQWWYVNWIRWVYFSCNTTESNPERFRILSSWTKLINVLWLEYSMMLVGVEKFGLNKNV